MPSRGQHLAGHRLVHGQGRREHSRTDVRDSHDLEHALERAVLAVGSVQADEGHVDLPLALDDLHGLGGRRRRRRGALDLLLEGGGQLAVPVGELLGPAGVSQQGPRFLCEIGRQRGVARHQGERIEQDDLVTVAREMFGDHAARGERDLALGGGAAQKDTHPDASTGVAHAGLLRTRIAGSRCCVAAAVTAVRHAMPVLAGTTRSIQSGRDARRGGFPLPPKRRTRPAPARPYDSAPARSCVSAPARPYVSAPAGWPVSIARRSVTTRSTPRSCASRGTRSTTWRSKPMPMRRASGRRRARNVS